MSFQEYTLDLEPLFYSPMDNVDFDGEVEEIVNFTTSDPTDATAEENGIVPNSDFAIRHDDPKNLLPYSSAEIQDPESGGGGWTTAGTTTLDRVVDASAPDGDMVWEITVGDSGGPRILRTSISPITPVIEAGTTITLSAWVFKPTGSEDINAQLIIRDREAGVHLEIHNEPVPFDTWTRISMTITVPEDNVADYFYAGFQGAGTVDDIYYVDAVQLETGDELTDYHSGYNEVVFPVDTLGIVSYVICIRHEYSGGRKIFSTNDVDIYTENDGTNMYIVIDGNFSPALVADDWNIVIYNDGVWTIESIGNNVDDGVYSQHIALFDSALTTDEVDDLVELAQNGYTIETINEGATLQLTDTGATGLAADWHIISV